MTFQQVDIHSTMPELLGAKARLLKTTGDCEPRRGHASELVGKMLLVVGGVFAQKSEYLHVAILNLDTMSWSRV
jgi:hypothetical protein